MINPTDCRKFAAQCIELANNSGNGNFQSILFNMAHEWTHIAEFREEKVLSFVDRRASEGNALGGSHVIQPWGRYDTKAMFIRSKSKAKRSQQGLPQKQPLALGLPWR
jgi:hypothetical protein